MAAAFQVAVTWRRLEGEALGRGQRYLGGERLRARQAEAHAVADLVIETTSAGSRFWADPCALSLGASMAISQG